MPKLMIVRRSGALPREIVLRLEVDRETDQRWIAELTDLPGVMAYGNSRRDAIERAAMLALRVIDDRRQHGEPIPDSLDPEHDGDTPASGRQHLHV